ncbi:MAG: CPBP family glutamic-type intramembrane protease [Actinomycetota bacterium]
MQPAVMVIGALAEVIGWRLVATGRATVWRLMPAVFVGMGVAAVLVRRPVVAVRVDDGVALGGGLASGLILYAGTRVFVAIAGRWEPFHRHVVEKYEEAATVSLRRSLVLSLLIMVPAEELFWRGLFQARVDWSLVAAAAGLWTWVAYVGVNLTSGSLPIVAGAVVGGALWAGLAVWSGGMLASLVSHMLWTGLMLAVPPGAGRGVRAA